MLKREEKMEVLQWHPAFYAGIQIEFEEEVHKLKFENEHQLGTKPKEIDVLIIKKNFEDQIQKNIGRIFRIHNIVEYKSPEDYLSVDDFYKVYGYACFYKSDVQQADQISVEDITISFVCRKYPKKMMSRNCSEATIPRGFSKENPEFCKQKSHCEAIFNGFLLRIWKVLNRYDESFK